MTKIDISKEYSKILSKYLKAFGLEPIDIAYLVKTKKEVIDGVLRGEKGMVLKTLEQISHVFGLRYFEFGNPNYPIPSFESLPDITKARIALRKKEGPPVETNYKTNDINQRIIDVLFTYKIGDEFLAEEIANKILKKYGETYSVSEIVDRFKKTFKNTVRATNRKDTYRKGRGPKPVFYRLVKIK